MSDPLEDFKERLAELAKLKQASTTAAKAAEAAKNELNRFQSELWQDMAAVDMDSVRTRHGRFTRQSTPYGVIVDREAFLEWCDEQGLLDSLTQEVEIKARLNELVRDRLNNNEELPPGTSFYAKEYISYTKS